MKLFLLALVAFAVCALTPAQAAPTPERPAPPGGGLLAMLSLGLLSLGAVALGGTRTLQDGQLIRTTVLPAAGAANNSLSIDTNTITPGRIPGVELGITLPATPSLVDAKTVTLKVQESDDNVTFTDAPDLPAVVATGAGGVGAAAVDRRFKVPIATKRYLRLSQAVLAAGGDNTAISASLGFYF